MKTTNLVRSSFLDYFHKLGHSVVPSGPLVPQNDPTLLFTSAGMVQFKDVFLGRERRSYTTATSAQKCLRAGGKHNDLENVGYTPRHHTFFEMLGNFSFGDYFKEKAILDAWTFVTKELGLLEEKLFITVYEEDQEAYSLWKKIANLPKGHLIRINTSDNFWSAGDSGPCGPCSEIFYDQGPTLQGGPPGSPTGDGDRFMEIWNLVFMQYLQSPESNKRSPLPMPCVDTGMGLERISSVLQGVTSNYETDTFQTLIQASVELTGVPYQGSAKVSHRIIADHMRAISFLIADGVLPTNEGRGYVLRRILRRAVRHAHLLNVKEPLLARLFPALSAEMGLVYPELLRASDLIQETLNDEECRFQETLTRGLRVLEESLETLPSGSDLPGSVAFKLYDTYGFPLDLTQDILKTTKRNVDKKEFDICMDKQRADARAAWSGSGETAQEGLWYELLALHGPTNFMGYATPSGEGYVQALIQGKTTYDSLSASPLSLEVLLNQTPFYGEAGGQLGDMGTFDILSPEGVVKGHMQITNTRKCATDLIVHEGVLDQGEILVGDRVKLHIDTNRRAGLSANHTATHLLHAALHALVGKTITQKGSLVAPDRLRFDFNAKDPLPWTLLWDIERWINEKIRNNTPVVTTTMDMQEALNSGAMALFGQKYTDQVRVVSINEADPSGGSTASTELCGGTHVEQTGTIGLFKIVGHSSVSSGVRRIEAVTGLHALAYIQQQEAILKEAAGLLKVQPLQLSQRLLEVLKEKKSPKPSASGGFSNHKKETKTIGDKTLLTVLLENEQDLNLKVYVETLKKELSSGIVLVVSRNGTKCTMALGVTSNLIPLFNAVELIRELTLKAGGQGGGGSPEHAQGGGKSDVPVSLLSGFLEEKMQQRLEKS